MTDNVNASRMWYREFNGQQDGPLTWDQLTALAAAGEVKLDTRVWSAGMVDWESAATVDGLMPTRTATWHLPAGQPPIPPQSTMPHSSAMPNPRKPPPIPQWAQATGHPTAAPPYGSPGVMPPGNLPPGAYPPGAYPPGAYPPGAYPPGAYPPGAYPPGAGVPLSYAQPYPPGAAPSALGDDPAMRWLLPVGRSSMAIGAGYLGLISLIPLVGPIALIASILAMFHLKKHPQLHGWGRAIFGLIMGILSTGVLLMIVANL